MEILDLYWRGQSIVDYVSQHEWIIFYQIGDHSKSSKSSKNTKYFKTFVSKSYGYELPLSILEQWRLSYNDDHLYDCLDQIFNIPQKIIRVLNGPILDKPTLNKPTSVDSPSQSSSRNKDESRTIFIPRTSSRALRNPLKVIRHDGTTLDVEFEVSAQLATSSMSLSSFARQIAQDYRLDYQPTFYLMTLLNDSQPRNRIFQKNDCVMVIPIKFKDSEQVVLNYNLGYLSRNNLYSEIIISLLCSQLRDQKLCFHFNYLLEYQILYDQTRHRLKQQLIFEQNDLLLSDLIFQLKEQKLAASVLIERINSLYLQVLFSIYLYQQYYQISHNDLHLRNIMVKVLGPRDSGYNQPYLFYNLKGRRFYVPHYRNIVRIIDFGISVKFQPPVIGFSPVLQHSSETGDPEYGPLVPNFWCPIYDPLYFTTVINSILATGLNKSFLSRLNLRGLIKRGFNYRPQLKDLDQAPHNIWDQLLDAPELDSYRQLKFPSLVAGFFR